MVIEVSYQQGLALIGKPLRWSGVVQCARGCKCYCLGTSEEAVLRWTEDKQKEWYERHVCSDGSVHIHGVL